MIAVALALAAATAYGASDFLGGLASRRSPVLAVAVVSHLVALAVTLALVPALGGERLLGDLAWGAGAGVANAVGIVFLYRGLARGRMAVVSPLTGVLAAVVPVAAGLLAGERPAALALAGVAVALLAIVLVSAAAPADPRRGEGLRASSPLLAFTASDVTDGVSAGLAYGAFLVLLGSTSGDAAVWPLVGVQVATVAVLAPLAWLTGRSVRPGRGALAGIAAAGLLGAGANAAYVVAAGRGLLSLVAVLASLYPAATVVLARLLLSERLSALQLAGLACAAVGVAAIAAG